MSTEPDNRMVWDRQQPGHYEVWYATFNHRPTSTGFWIRYTVHAPASPQHGTAPQAPTCRLWFAYFDAKRPRRNLALNQVVPIEQLEVSDTPFRIGIGNAVLEHGTLRGALRDAEHEVSWDLSFVPSSFTHHHLPQFAYEKDFIDTKALSPNLMINLSGEVRVDQRTFELAGEPGCQTHTWGRKHPHSWAWSHCSSFREDPTAVLEAVSARVSRAGLVAPAITLVSLYLGSEVYHFQQPHLVPLARGRWETGLYRINAYAPRVKLEAEIRARPEDMVRAEYRDPDGDAVFCHNTEVADATLVLWTRRSLLGSFRQLCRLTSRTTTHFEYASRAPDGAIERLHQPVTG